jgi:hypothetical protein
MRQISCELSATLVAFLNQPACQVYIQVMKTLTLVALAAAALPNAARAQVATLDEGSFTVTIKGDRVAREDFRIRRTPGGPTGWEVVATSTSSYGSRRVLSQLRSDSSGAPNLYVVEVKGPSGDERFEGAVGRNRVSARVRNARGESANEFMVTPGAIVIDDEVFHQYYFLTRRPAGSVSVIIPRRNTQVVMRIADAGSDKVTIGGASLDARHFTIADPGGADREVWADASGRLLKVAIPSRGVVALRDDPPR